MRITHVITRLIIGGAQENTVASVLGLSRKPNCEVNLLSGPSPGPEGCLEHEFDTSPNLLMILPELVRPVHPARDLAALRRLTSIFRAKRPDIVHTHSGKAGILGRLAAHRAGVPIIVHTIHGPSFGRFQGPLANLIFRAAERHVGRITTHFVVVADAMREQYLNAGIGRSEQYTKIFSGFPLAPFQNAHADQGLRERLAISESDVVVGKIARLFPLKGHEDLFAAASGIVQTCPNVKFLLIGDGILRSEFQKRLRSLGLEKYFVFAGLVPPGEVPNYVGIMDLLVHLSSREGLPRALPQAMAAGKPVVAYDCDGAKEVCLPEQTGLLIAPGDIAGLQAAIARLTRDKRLRSEFGRRGQAFVQQRFEVSAMIESLDELYRRLTG
jgi:glycosyltransferase involved in cell wall biosynthesis